MSASTISMIAGVVMTLAGCSTLPAGRGYTMAKASIDGGLVEARRVLSRKAIPDCEKTVSVDCNDLDRAAPNGTLGIKLNAGYIRYLESIKRSNVAVFSRVVVRNAGEVANGLVWESVFTPNKDEKVQTVIDKDTTLPFQDVDILPAIDYTDQDVTVELRVVSMKQEDNERLQTLISAAAAGAAFAKPEAAATISVFQAVLTFLVQNRPDTIEFAFNFKVSPSETARLKATAVSGLEATASPDYTELTLAPRVGSYAVIKTEHDARLNYPSEYLGFASDGIRYGLAQVLKLATLGVFNWPIWSGPPQEDFYLLLMGRPFSVARSSWLLPEWRDGVLVTSPDQWPDWNFTTSWHPKRAALPTAGKAIRVINGALDVCYETDASHHKDRCVAYREQSYLILSLVSPFQAIPFDVIKAAADQQKAIEDLGIRTTWLSAADQKKGLDAILNSFKGLVANRTVRENCQKRLAKAKDDTELASIEKACTEELANGTTGLTKETHDAAKKSFDDWIAQRIDRRKKQLGSPAPGDATGTGNPPPSTPAVDQAEE